MKKRHATICALHGKAAVKPSQQLSSLKIVSLWDSQRNVGYYGHVIYCGWWTVTCLTKDIADFVSLLEWDSDFSSKYPYWILNKFSKRPKLLSGLNELDSFYLNWRRTYHFYNSHCQISGTFWLSDELNALETQLNIKIKILDLCARWLLTRFDIWSPTHWTHCFLLLRACHIFKGLTPEHLRMTALAKSITKPLPQWTIEPILPANQHSDFHPNISATFEWTLVA